MLDAENDYFSTPMARPYGYVAPRLVARIFQSPRGNLEIALRDLCITQPPSQNILPGGNTGLRLPAPRQAHSPSGYTGIYGYCSNFAVTSPPNIFARPGRRCPHFMVKWRFTEILGRVVGAARFELTTPCTQNRCATRLRHAPTLRLL